MPVSLRIPHMDLAQIAESGQCFTWRALAPGRYAVAASGRRLECAQAGDSFTFSCTRGEWDAFWADYFDLGTDYGAIKAAIDPDDPCLTAAARAGWGIRVLRQDFWEVAVSFLISQNNNITRIKRSVTGLCEAYGRPIGPDAWSFPRPDDLAGVPEAAFQALGLGYRAKYLAALAGRMAHGGLEEFLAPLAGAEPEEARRALLTLYGVGGKVADCILLFGLHRVDAFPVDTHIRQLLARHYPGGFPYGRYRGFLGILQQYLFYYDLKGPAGSVERV